MESTDKYVSEIDELEERFLTKDEDGEDEDGESGSDVGSGEEDAVEDTVDLLSNVVSGTVKAANDLIKHLKKYDVSEEDMEKIKGFADKLKEAEDYFKDLKGNGAKEVMDMSGEGPKETQGDGGAEGQSGEEGKEQEVSPEQ